MHKIDRLQLIRERHRKVILEPRERKEFDIFDEWNEEFDFVDEELLTRQLRVAEDEE
jgi:predicted nucleic acid-binding OB-fold protein